MTLVWQMEPSSSSDCDALGAPPQVPRSNWPKIAAKTPGGISANSPALHEGRSSFRGFDQCEARLGSL